MTAALEGGEWSAARPGRTLPSGKTRYPLYRRLGGPQGRSGWAENLVPTGILSRTVQPVVSRYTDWTTRPTVLEVALLNNIKDCHILHRNIGMVHINGGCFWCLSDPTAAKGLLCTNYNFFITCISVLLSKRLSFYLTFLTQALSLVKLHWLHARSDNHKCADWHRGKETFLRSW